MEENDRLYCLEVLTFCSQKLASEQYETEEIIFNLENVIQTLRIYRNSFAIQILVLIEEATARLDYQTSRIHCVGRPKIPIPTSTLEFLLSLNFKVTKIATILGISERTAWRRMNEANLTVRSTFTEIGDDSLDSSISNILISHPDTGYKRLRGFLLNQGIKVTKMRVLEGLRRVDPVGVERRRCQNRAIVRREYFVRYSMEIWHIDTHHKLIRWGIIIRGGIDGKSRTIVFLDAGNDNTAVSNFNSFLNGISSYGVPSRTRSDKGGENVDVARFMLENRSTGRGSHICGRSVHNQRIERLWRDVHYGCLSAFRRAFCYLEDAGLLDIDNQKQLAVLQMIFIPRIRRSLNEFMSAWNHHPLSSEHNSSPIQLLFQHLPPADNDLLLQPAPVNELSDSMILENEQQLHDFDFNAAVNLENHLNCLTNEEFHVLQQINPIRDSADFGVDIYLEALQAITSI